MHVLGIDPGGTTGVAVLSVHEGRLVEQAHLRRAGVYENLERLVGMADVVAIERFVISQRTLTKSRQMDAMYVVGAVEYVCSQRGVGFYLQLVSDAKAAFSDQMLRSLGLYSTNRHERDAIRHALLLARRLRLDVRSSS